MKVIQEKEQKSISRREFLKASAAVGAAALLAACAPGAAPTAPAAPAAPAAQEKTRLHVLRWSSFVAPMDETLIQQAEEWSQQEGVEVTIERIGANDIPTRLSAAIQAGAGPDIIQFWDNWPWLFRDQLVPVDDVMQDVIADLGEPYEIGRGYCFVEGNWMTVPYSLTANNFVYRQDWFEEVLGTSEGPATIDEMIEMSKALKEAGHPAGQALGHSFGDPPTWAYYWLWSHGGREVQEDGKTVVLNSDETLMAVERAVEWFKTGVIEGVLAWDDSSNNRAYLAGEICFALNGASIYFAAKQDFPEIAEVSNHFIHPEGPGGRYTMHLAWSSGIMNYSQAQDAAKDFLRFVMQKQNISEWMQSGPGYETPPYPGLEDDPTWEMDPKIVGYRDVVTQGNPRWPGWPGPPSANAFRARNDYIIVDLFAKAVSGEMSPQEAVEWATKELEQRYQG